MRHHDIKNHTIAALCCTAVFLIGCERKASPSVSSGAVNASDLRIVARPEAADLSGEMVTTSNSAQYAKDFAAIDTLHFSICATALNADGSLNPKKPRWQLYLSPKDATAAHAFLRRLLADYPLHQPFSGQQAQYMTDEDHYLCFFEQTGSEKYENVFTVKVFIWGLNFMDVEQRVRLQGNAFIGVAGTQVPVEGKAKAELFTFMATCAEQSGETETAQALKRIAEGALVEHWARFVLLSIGLVVVSVILIALVWQFVRPGQKVKASEEPVGQDVRRLSPRRVAIVLAVGSLLFTVVWAVREFREAQSRRQREQAAEAHRLEEERKTRAETRPIGPETTIYNAWPFDEAEARQRQEETARTIGQPVELTNSIGMRLRLIPAGEFLMGSPDDEKERTNDEEPLHRVSISKPFYLGMHEVTQAEYEQVMGTNPSTFRMGGERKEQVANLDTSRFPVETVRWSDAKEFCRRLSSLPEESSAGRTYWLPTEAEWEYACRAGTTTPFHFGSILNGQQANCDGDAPFGTEEKGPSLKRPTYAGSYAPNAFGLYDMHGNILEWCDDGYGKDYDANSPQSDPTGLPFAMNRVLRGGSWTSAARKCRSATRFVNHRYNQFATVGLRVMLVPLERRVPSRTDTGGDKQSR